MCVEILMGNTTIYVTSFRYITHTKTIHSFSLIIITLLYYVCGDTHGQYYDLCHIFQVHHTMTNTMTIHSLLVQTLLHYRVSYFRTQSLSFQRRFCRSWVIFFRNSLHSLSHQISVSRYVVILPFVDCYVVLCCVCSSVLTYHIHSLSVWSYVLKRTLFLPYFYTLYNNIMPRCFVYATGQSWDKKHE